jgi:hypothetical protein
MRKLKLLLLLVTIITLQSCKKSNSGSENSDEFTTYEEEASEEAYPDGTYCADIDYYNPDTGTRSTYTLNVEVESNEVTVIQWSNGGWLDSTHFSPEELDSSGSCSFTTYDGNQYDIQITGSECSSTDENAVSSNDYYEKQKVTCPECGDKKYSYDDVCDNCNRKQKDKKEHTCKRCGEYDTFMWSSDDLCSDCKRDEEDKKREEEEQNSN